MWSLVLGFTTLISIGDNATIIDAFEEAAGIEVGFSLGHFRVFQASPHRYLFIFSKAQLSQWGDAHLVEIHTDAKGRISSVRPIVNRDEARRLAQDFRNIYLEVEEFDLPIHFQAVIETLSNRCYAPVRRLGETR